MKNIVRLLVIFVLVLQTLRSEDPREFFRRMMEIAHPTPEQQIKELPLIPLAEPKTNPLFYNISTTVDETGQFQMQNESSIAVNPVNPRVLIASAVDYRDTSATWVYFSTDGGKSWKNKKLGRPFPNWRSSNDPSVAYSYDGIGYLVYGGFGNVSDTGLLYGENGVFLARTTDDGKTWDAHIPIIVHRGVQTLDSAFEDKYYITVDNSPNSPYRGTLYVPWKRVIPRDSSTQIVISRSTDRGNTWSEPIPISPRKPGTSEDTTFGQSFPLATIGPNGEVYVVWNDGIEKGIGFARSSDGGATFSEPRIIIRYKPFGKAKLIPQQGYRHTVKEKVRAEAYPSIVCDYTGGERNGYLYLCWSADNPPNVYFSYSTDGGNSWSEPKIVHSDTTNDQFWQWIALDPKNGDLAIMYLDSRRDPQNLLTECWVSYSSDGGKNWIDRPVSDIASDLRLNPFTDNSFAGDYSGCAFFHRKIYPSWVDMRNAIKNIYDSDVYTAYISLNCPNPPENFIAKTLPDEPKAILLTWTTPKTKVFGHPLDTSKLTFQLKREGTPIAILPANVNSYKDTGLTAYKLYNYSIASVTPTDTSVEVFASAYAGGARNPLAPQILSTIDVEGSTEQICVQLPSRRADSTTPLVNLRRLLVYDEDNLLFQVDIDPKDTGKVHCFNFDVQKEGFYKVKVKAVDSDQNQSTFSNEFPVFKGKVFSLDDETKIYGDDFSNTSPRKYLKYNGWDYTSTFFHSPPSCITDSPQGNYPNRTEMILGLLPFKISPNVASQVNISFQHSAIIHRTDTGYVELVNKNGQFVQLGAFNMESYPYWKDKMLDQNDWREEIFSLNISDLQQKLGTDFLFLRFRLVSGTLGTDDGWYIDDVQIRTGTSSVENLPNEQEIILSPNPARSFVKIRTNYEISNIAVYDLFGNSETLVPIYKNGNERIFDVNHLGNGVYFLEITPTHSNGKIILPFAVLH